MSSFAARAPVAHARKKLYHDLIQGIAEILKGHGGETAGGEQLAHSKAIARARFRNSRSLRRPSGPGFYLLIGTVAGGARYASGG